MQILIIWNNHDFGVLMNGNLKCVENQGKNSECMHVKCKYVVIVIWNNSARIKFHFYHLVTILWGIIIIIIIIIIIYDNDKVFYKFCCWMCAYCSANMLLL
jgi:hypothetical protein